MFKHNIYIASYMMFVDIITVTKVVIGGDDNSLELMWIRVEFTGRVFIGAQYHQPRLI